MAGLRERKKRATRAAIHHAALRLFAEHGFGRTTIDQIADAADVARATVFSYFASKEDIVFGDAPTAVEALADVLRERPVIPAVREWLGSLEGWIERDLVLQLRLAREVPSVGARRLQIYGDIERVVADALEAELGERLPAELAAASLMAGLRIVEETAAARMEQESREMPAPEREALLDDAIRFAEAGIGAVKASA